jgi:hypothetical protein
MVEDARGSVTISFDPNCRPKLVRHKTRYVDQMDAFAAAANIVRMSDVDFEFLYGGSDFAGKRSHLSRRVQVLSSLRAEQGGLRLGIGRRARLKSRRPPRTSWIRSGRGTAFKQRYCSHCTPSDGSEADRWRRRMPMSFFARCRLRRSVPHSHVGAPAQILHGNLMLARHSIVFCRIAFVRRNERHQDTGLSMV